MSSYLLVRHKVRDFSEWKRGYDDHLPKRIDSGLTQKYLLHEADDANEVTILFEAADINRARAFVESADLKETMEKVGVIGKSDIHILNG